MATILARPQCVNINRKYAWQLFKKSQIFLHFTPKSSTSNISLFQRTQKLIRAIFMLGILMDLSCCKIMKNKMCLQFECNNYVSNGTAVIDSISGTTKKRCLSSCVRTNSCSAFHFRPNDGNCELLKSPEKCMSHAVTMGTVFVQLTKCDGRPPWKVVSPALSKLQWRGQYNIGDRKAVRAIRGGRGIVRALYQGMYLTGFFLRSPKTSFIVDRDDKQFDCPRLYQVLTCADKAHYSWLIYDVGAPIPASTVVGGYWLGVPLYVVSVKTRIEWKQGYYNAFTKQAHVARFGNTRGKPTMLLVENWFDSEHIYNVEQGILVGPCLCVNLSTVGKPSGEHLRKKPAPSLHSATWWRHQMETFSALLAICTGNSPVTGDFPN